MNKLTKVLSIFVLMGAIGTGVAGVAGCSNSNENEHVHNYTYVNDNNGKHHEHCDVDGCDAPDKAAEDHNWVGDKCDKCNADKPAENLVVAADVTGILIEGVTSETITLNETKKNHTIDKSAIKVYFATGNNADVKGAEVPAANVLLELKDETGAAVSSWENITKDGVYKVNASIKDATMASGAVATLDDLKTTVTVTVSNPVKADSLAVKTGTLTQTASVQDKMTSDWKYTVTLANGDVIDYTEAVTVTVNTSAVGKQTATLTSGNLTGTVEVEITASELRTETYAVNLSGKEAGEIASQDPAGTAVELFKSANGNTKLEARGLRVEANGNSAAKECDGKFFANRGTLLGATFTSAGALQVNQRYFILNTEGAAKLTIYWSRNSSSDERGVSVFNSTVAGGDISTLVPGAETVGKATVVGDGTAATQGVQKLEVNIPAAGTYWITSANNQNVYFYYIELTTEFAGAGQSVVLEDGAKTLAQVKVSHTTTDYKQEFTVGDTFSVDAGYSIKGTFITANTAKKSEETLTEVTYWLGTTQLVPGTTVLTSELFDSLGENTVTVKYGNETVTGSYQIFVDSAVPGVTGIKANVKSTVNPVLASATAKLTLAKTDIEAAIVGENTNATLNITSVKYKVKGAEAATEITETAELGEGEYVIVVVATVTDATANKSAEFEATVALKVSVAGNGASWLYQGANATIGADNPNIAKDEVIDENGSFKAVAMDSAKSGYNRDSTNFATKITDTSNAPKAAADKTASGEEMTFTNAVAFDTKAGDGKDYIKITAKKATTVYIYINGSDDKHGSNRSGAIVYYSVNGTACAASEEITIGNRKAVTVLKVTLKAGDELIVSVKKGTATDPRVWFYGIEAVDVVDE